MERPQPRLALGQALRGVATSAIDVSDGLLGDLGHILRRSQVGATLEVDALPRSAVLRTLPAALQREFALAGGDDYENASGVGVTRIGRLDAEPGLRLIDANGAAVVNGFGSFDHFKS